MSSKSNENGKGNVKPSSLSLSLSLSLSSSSSSNMRFLSSNDIERIKKSISHTSDNVFNNDEIQHKEKLKELSTKRVAGWTDTLESARDAKLKWKRDNQEREEAKRKEIDKEEEIIKAKFRADTIQRAKDLQYEEKEKVKFLRSQQLYTDVVETRKKQIEEKMEREKHAAEEERRWHEHTVKMVQEAERKNKEKALLQKKRALENAEAMNRQRIEAEKCRKKILAAQRKAEEATINQAQAEISNMQEKLRKQKTNMKRKCKEEMEMLFKDIEIKNEQMQEKEMRDEKKRQDDIARMAFLATARANLEIKHFEERQATRKILSDRAAEDLKARSSREVEIFIREQKAQESKEKAKKEEEIRLKKEMEKEIHQSRKEQIKMRQERREREIAEEKVLTEQYKQMTLQDLQREKKKDSELRRRHNDIRAFQLQQIEEKQKIRIKEKESRLEEAKKMAQQLVDEDNAFKEFAMKEMQRFKDVGKKTDLLKKATIS